MNLYKDINELPDFHHSVITMGSFDGVHTGHQMLINRIKSLAKECKGESVLLTFHPHPRYILRPNSEAVKLITTIEERAALLAHYGLDHLVVIPFDKAFANLSPEAYIESFLVKHFSPKHIVVGYDHRFGKNRAGDVNTLRKEGAKFGFELEQIDQHEVQDIGVSSRKIREALKEGNVQKANRLLGHHFTLEGEVVKGDQIGRQIGFPTANIQVAEPHKLIPAIGIYAVKAIVQEEEYEGMLYIGNRPTLGIDPGKPKIEVNLFGFSRDIYGERLKIIFVEHIRADVQFQNMEALTAQLHKDELAAKNVFLKELK